MQIETSKHCAKPSFTCSTHPRNAKTFISLNRKTKMLENEQHRNKEKPKASRQRGGGMQAGQQQ
uniref:Uncharacterized protein n=1 Tax=Rhizophora mucronata TaxID=61149 RepID=A0A2P2LM98_RHIMU